MKEGMVDGLEMARTFNCGIGMVVVVAPEEVEEVMRMLLKEVKEVDVKTRAEVYEIGKIVSGKGVQMRNLEAWRLKG
jgi:phosphoribosylamine--glycine ligase/phosphoribosylformylglycinamidine cyclo-ligase